MSKEKTQTAVSSLSFTAPETCFYRADSTALKVKFSFFVTDKFGWEFVPNVTSLFFASPFWAVERSP